MYLITKKEMKIIENIRNELCNTSYLAHSHQTQKLYKIVNRNRNFKWFIKNIGG